MCGIVGVFGESSNLNLGKSISLMTQTLTHRGPDDSGTWVKDDRKLGFGHRRLSIIDTSKVGKQPFVSNDGNYIIIFNE